MESYLSCFNIYVLIPLYLLINIQKVKYNFEEFIYYVRFYEFISFLLQYIIQHIMLHVLIRTILHLIFSKIFSVFEIWMISLYDVS